MHASAAQDKLLQQLDDSKKALLALKERSRDIRTVDDDHLRVRPVEDSLGFSVKSTQTQKTQKKSKAATRCVDPSFFAPSQTSVLLPPKVEPEAPEAPQEAPKVEPEVVLSWRQRK